MLFRTRCDGNRQSDQGDGVDGDMQNTRALGRKHEYRAGDELFDGGL